MSYTYLLEQGEESSAGCFSDIPQSVLLNLNLTAEKSYSNGNETESCQGSQSGMMSAPSTETRGKEKSMSSAGVFPVKTSQQQEKEPGSQENEAVSGQKWPESLAKYDPNTHSLRTHQCLLFEDSTECLETFPKWGMMHDGELWELTMSAHLIEENESGLLPTPRKSGQSRAFKCYKREDYHGNLEEYLAANGYENWISPSLTETMMKFPISWTDISPLEMHKFQQWQHSHGEFLEENK